MYPVTIQYNSSDCNDFQLPSPIEEHKTFEPLNLKVKGRKTFNNDTTLRSKSRTNDSSIVERSIVPSDQAFIDAILEKLNDHELSRIDDFDIICRRMSYREEHDGLLCITYQNQVLYRDQVIFDLSTLRRCDGVQMSGQISTCCIRNGCLRIKYCDKQSTIMMNGRDTAKMREKIREGKTWKKHKIPLAELVRKSAQIRQQQLLSAHDSLTSVIF